MNRAWRFFLVGHLQPLTLVGLLLAVVVYRARHFQLRDGALTCIAGSFERATTPAGPFETVTRIWGRPSAQTLGTIVIFDSEHSRARADLRVHELVHVVQMYLFMIGAPVLVAPVVHALQFDLVWLLASGPVGALLFAINYGVFFLVPFARRGFKNWYAAYRANPFEVHAYAEQDEYLELRPSEQTQIWGHR